MSIRLQGHQPDLLCLAARFTNQGKLPPEVRVTVLALLKQLLGECVPVVTKTRSVDE